MTRNPYVYIAVMFLVTYAVRALPLTLIQKQVNNRFFKSFLYYVPYVTLSVMIFPAILEATRSPIAGAAALVAGVAIAWLGGNLFVTSVACGIVVLALEFFLI